MRASSPFPCFASNRERLAVAQLIKSSAHITCECDGAAEVRLARFRMSLLEPQLPTYPEKFGPEYGCIRLRLEGSFDRFKRIGNSALLFLRFRQPRGIKTDAHWHPNFEQVRNALTNQRHPLCRTAEMRSRLTENTSGKCCLIRKLMLLRKGEGARCESLGLLLFPRLNPQAGRVHLRRSHLIGDL